MKPCLSLLCVLVACSTGPDQPPLPEPPAPAAPAVVVAPSPLHAVTQEFQAATQQEPHAVTAPGATAEYVDRVHAADVDVRQRLADLRRKLNPSPAAIEAARQAIRVLTALLRGDPAARNDHGDSP